MIITNKNRKKEIIIPEILPLLPIRDIAVFPYMVIPLAVGREKSIKALDEAMLHNRLIFLPIICISTLLFQEKCLVFS